MTFRTTTLERMDKRVQELIRGFSNFVKIFEDSGRFSGPSIYFHRRTLERLRAHGSVTEALGDDAFIESLYATLVSWGMHRMGGRGARMVDFDAFKASLLSQQERIEQLRDLRLSQISTTQLAAITRDLWSIISDLNIGVGETKIVIGTKTLHHVIPELVPPMDRRYTLRFFFEHTNMNQGGQMTFAEIFPRFHHIAKTSAEEIASLIGIGPMSTSSTKIIDNAIVGYGIERLRIKEEEQ
jgi:hypothetical protein